jgi:hypothetical protein
MKQSLLFIVLLFVISTTMAQLTSVNVVKNNDVSCFGMNDGSATAFPVGGTGPYTYQWDDPSMSTTDNVFNLIGGSYNVTVTDTYDMSQAFGNVIINVPNELFVSMSKTDPTCFQMFNGSINANVSGGTTPYTYNWSPALMNASLVENLSGGWYDLTVTDSQGCMIMNSIELNIPNEIVLNHIISNSCSGMSNGSVDISVTGGMVPYNYEWSNFTYAEDLTGVTAGFYMVTVTDFSGCIMQGNYEVMDMPGLSLMEQSTTLPTCPLNCDGSITVIASGGVSPYSFQWDANAGNQFGNVATNLCGGNSYGVTATDGNGCTATYWPWLGNNDFNAWVNNVNPNCFDECTGEATVMASGGNSPYSYQWDSNAGNSTSQTLTGMCPGYYYVTVSDNLGCQTQTWVEIYNPSQISLTFNVTDVSCNGMNDGFIDLFVSNGFTPYTFQWTDAQTTEDIGELFAGNYSITVTDANNCQEIGMIDVYQPNELFANPSYTDVSCYGINDGYAAVFPSGGNPPYIIEWLSGQNVSQLFNVPADTYSVNVTDNNGCYAYEMFQVNQPEQIVVDVLSTSATCGNSDGGATVNVMSGGIAPFSYQWSNNTYESSLTNVSSGVYNVTVTDFSGCSVEKFVLIEDQGAPVISLDYKDDVLCFGGSNGSVGVIVTSGIPPYNYLWSNSTINTNLSGVVADKYFLTVTDDLGCNGLFNLEISQPEKIKSGIDVMPITCPGLNNGNILISPSGGISPYTYYWSFCSDYMNFNTSCPDYYQVSTTSTEWSGLVPGAYELQIFDQNGCSQIIDTVIMIEPSLILTDFTVQHPKCSNGFDGAIDLTVTGGTPPYTYQWQSNQTSEDIDFLYSGIYHVTVNDNYNCQAVGFAELLDPPAINASWNVTEPTCNDYSNGAIDVTPTGGTPPYTFSWSNGATTEDLTGVKGNFFNLYVYDSYNCYGYYSIELPQPDKLMISTGFANATCGNSDGSAYVMINSGGVPPFTYNWTGGLTVDSIINLSFGTYHITVTDASGCTAISFANISESGAPNITWNAWQDVTCFGYANGSIDAYAWGGTSPYTYNWSGPNSFISSSEDLTGLPKGLYFLTVTDAAACNVIFEKEINEPQNLVIEVNNYSNIGCFGDSTGTVYTNAIGGTFQYNFEWSNGVLEPNLYNMGPGTYTLTVTDANSCYADTTISFTEPPAIVITSVIFNDATCNGFNNGSIQMSAAGGTGQIEYSIYGESNYGLTNFFDNLYPGPYFVSVRDENMCSVFWGHDTIKTPDILEASLTTTDASCSGFLMALST